MTTTSTSALTMSAHIWARKSQILGWAVTTRRHQMTLAEITVGTLGTTEKFNEC